MIPRARSNGKAQKARPTFTHEGKSDSLQVGLDPALSK
jgi:hypothetical protein